jgi:hypothetical protein
MMPHSYSMTSDSEGNDVPPDASFSNGPLNGGFDARVVAWPNNGSIGLEGRYKGYVDALEVSHEDTKSFGSNFHIGGRYRGGGHADVLLVRRRGLRRHLAGRVPLRVDRARYRRADPRSPSTALGLGPGFLVDEGKFAVDVNLTEMFAPAPVDTALSGTVDYKIADDIAIRGGLDFDLIATDIEVGDETAKVTDIQYGINIGVAYLMF